jgi:preprotein translocase subunit SecA
MLQVLDTLWKEHLSTMDHLRQGIHLRAYAQKNPKQEYKREAFEMFQALLARFKHEITTVLARVHVPSAEDLAIIEAQRRKSSQMQFVHPEADKATGSGGAAPPPAPSGQADQRQQPFVRDGRKIGRNEPCPCGSGKKFKQCHGRLT